MWSGVHHEPLQPHLIGSPTHITLILCKRSTFSDDLFTDQAAHLDAWHCKIQLIWTKTKVKMRVKDIISLQIRIAVLISGASFANPSVGSSVNSKSTESALRVSNVKQQPLVENGGSIPSTIATDHAVNRSSIFASMLDSLETMQSHYFQLWQGTWPSSIDWTAAVLGTYLSGTLSSFTSSIEYIITLDANNPSKFSNDAQKMENLINKYFSQVISFYFGQDAFSLRTQAYDDMLWVVLGWIEGIKFVNLHSSLHYTTSQKNQSYWYGTQFIPAFAHRARVFYDLASRGWDTDLCGGGMIWSPYLRPYKNAITNELFITASISMYLYFPGDDNSSPFTTGNAGILPARPHDPKYLDAAVNGYDWLSASNMTNWRGLYVDGFHIRRNGERDANKRCDDRNEMVYTYNQGVLLSGLRGLWEATGSTRYLDDAHNLVRSVITSTGWNIETNSRSNGRWAGLGRDGILEELCDAGGYCSQNGQTFKGIFFHHLTAFCAPLPSSPLLGQHSFAADQATAESHQSRCTSYQAWIIRNARAAYATRDSKGNYGMWWGEHEQEAESQIPYGADDFQNRGFPGDHKKGGRNNPKERVPTANRYDNDIQRDVNDRGRGRTVETQGGGVSVLRAMWELT